MGRNCHGSILTWADFVMGRNDPEPDDGSTYDVDVDVVFKGSFVLEKSILAFQLLAHTRWLSRRVNPMSVREVHFIPSSDFVQNPSSSFCSDPSVHLTVFRDKNTIKTQMQRCPCRVIFFCLQ